MTQHTPTPWNAYVENKQVFLETSDHRIIGNLGITTSPESKANAAFIVKAVNAHDDLVEALEKIADASTYDVEPTTTEMMLYQRMIEELACKAIAKTKGAA